MKYLVHGLGRTGSHIILSYLELFQPHWRGKITRVTSTSWASWSEDRCYPGPLIVQDHWGWLPPKDQISQWRLILSDRRDLVAWACSRWVSEKTRLYNSYATWDPLSRYTVPVEYVSEWQSRALSWRRDSEIWLMLPWQQSSRVYKEDLPEITPQLPPALQSVASDASVSRKSWRATPWDYSEIITNWQELRQQFSG